MAFWRQMKKCQITAASNYLRGWYIHYLSSDGAKNIASCPKIVVWRCLSSPLQRSQIELPKSNVRFYAAPVQAIQKKEENAMDGPRLNNQIKADVVRLVTDKGHSILPILEALRLARSLNLDLVEVQRNAKPPVCKLMDYNREKYKQDLKEKDRVKGKSETTLRSGACKEIRFVGRITQKDLQIKADMVKRLMERGHRVKCVAVGSIHKQTGEGEDSATLLARFFSLIKEISVVESETRVQEKDQAHVIVRHVKFGPLKKGSVKKVGKDGKLFSPSPQEGKGENDVSPGGMLDDDLEQQRPQWKVFDVNSDFENSLELEDHCDEDVEILGPSMASEAAPHSSRSVPSLSSNCMPEVDPSSKKNNRYTKDSGNSPQHYSPRDDIKSPLRNQIPNRGRRPQINESTLFRRETEYVDNGSPRFENSKFPKQDVSPSRIPSSPNAGYGIFSPRQADNDLGGHSSQTPVNRYKQKNPSNTARNSRVGGV